MSTSTFVAGQPGLDPTLPDVSLILNGVERHLCYDHNAIAQVEKITGLNLLFAAAAAPNATALRALLWAALLRETPGLSLEEVGSWMTPQNIPTIHAALQATWYGSVPEDDGEVGEVQAQALPNA